MIKVWLTCVCVHLDLILGGLAHGNQDTNTQTDEQMKMDEWRLKDEDGRVHEQTNHPIINQPILLCIDYSREGWGGSR